MLVTIRKASVVGLGTSYGAEFLNDAKYHCNTCKPLTVFEALYHPVAKAIVVLF